MEKEANAQMEIDTSTTTFGSSSNDDGKFEGDSLSVCYPKDIGAELEKAWPKVQSALEKLQKYGISCTLNLVEGYMTVFTTRKNREPKYFRKAAALITLLSQRAPPLAALNILWKQSDIINIGTQKGGICSKIGISEEEYIKRRKFLTRSALEALSQLTGCDLIFRNGNHIVATGSAEGLRFARRMVERFMVHRVFPRSQIMKIKSMDQAIDDLGALRF